MRACTRPSLCSNEYLLFTDHPTHTTIHTHAHTLLISGTYTCIFSLAAIIHRDLKTPNVLITNGTDPVTGQKRHIAKVADLGLAQSLGAMAELRTYIILCMCVSLYVYHSVHVRVCTYIILCMCESLYVYHSVCVHVVRVCTDHSACVCTSGVSNNIAVFI